VLRKRSPSDLSNKFYDDMMSGWPRFYRSKRRFVLHTSVQDRVGMLRKDHLEQEEDYWTLFRMPPDFGLFYLSLMDR